MKRLLIVIVIAFCFKSQAQLTTIFNFNNTTTGGNTRGSLISDGTYLYGTTNSGGANDSGTIFRIKPNGTGYLTLYDFTKSSGDFPWGGSLVYDNTYLYGIATNGGVNNMGVVFRIKPDGTGYTKLLEFTGLSNGSYPFGTLYYDGTYLFGTTYSGGANNYGTIFKILTNGTGYVKLYDFTGNGHGGNPASALISDGTYLYGTARGDNTIGNPGVLFKIKTDGSSFTELSDLGNSDSYSSPILLGNDLYFLTSAGGTYNAGGIYKVKTDGTQGNTLHVFGTPGFNEGKSPFGNLIYDGIFLYGLTAGGSPSDGGNAFRIKPNGTKYNSFYYFGHHTNDGVTPYGSLVLDSGLLYGMTSRNDVSMGTGYGTVFSLVRPVYATDTTICIGGTATLTASYANTYTWSTGATGISIVVSPTVTTSYTVKGVYGNDTSSYTTIVTVLNTVPTITVAPNSDTICRGTSVALNASGAHDYAWSPSSSLSNSGISNPVATPTTSTTYTVIGSNACGNSAPVNSTLIVNPTPTVSIVGLDSQTVCSGQNINSITFNVTPNGNITWYNNNTHIGLSSYGSGNVNGFVAPTVTVQTTGLINGTAITLNGCSSDSSTQAVYKITINPVPVLSVNSSTVCLGDTAVLIANGASSYTWTPATNLNNANIGNPLSNPNATTVYTVTGSNFCGASSPKTATVTVRSLPTLTATANSDTICEGNSHMISVNSNTGYSYTWSPNNAINNIHIPNPTVSPTTTTVYSVTAIDTYGCSSIPATVTVNVNPMPVITIPGPNFQTVCGGGSVAGITFSVNPVSTVNWTNSDTTIGLAAWGSGDINGFSASTITSVTSSIITIGATSSANCSTSASAATHYTITVMPNPNVNFTLTANPTPHVWDTYPAISGGTTPYNYLWNWGDGTTDNILYTSHIYTTAGNYSLCLTVTDANGCSGSYCQNDSLYRTNGLIQINVINGSTGTNQTTGKYQLSIYPNPANTIVQIRGVKQQEEVQVLDVTGRDLYCETLEIKENIRMLDVSKLTNGIYFVRIKTFEGVSTHRIMVQH
ncbi:MAG: choice-of-anchor tandem repeat GloVer-containing protein [Bacteroidia bacterium]